MRNGLWTKGLVIGIIILFIGTSFFPGINANMLMDINETDENNPNENLVPLDQLDQSQTKDDCYCYGVIKTGKIAQSYIPTLNTLTRVQLLCYKTHTSVTGDIIVSIRCDLSGSDLTSKSLPISVFPYEQENRSWVEFDFPDIAVTPGQTYYIIWSRTYTPTADDPNGLWFSGSENPYINGCMWRYTVDGWRLFENNRQDDLCFKTYGTGGNNNPNTPSNPNPTNHVTWIDINADLSWDGGDQDTSDTVYYEIYFGTTTPPPFKTTTGTYPATQTRITYDPETMITNKKYYWKIVSHDNHGGITSGNIWDFTTSSNSPPNTPSNPNPPNQATEITIDATLSWTGGDPDNDPVTYDIYLSQTNPPNKAVSGLTASFYDPNSLKGLTTYYWKVVAIDSHSKSTEGLIWMFTTKYENTPPSQPVINGEQNCVIGRQYNYLTTAADSDADQLYYQWAWTSTPRGDISFDKYSDWIGPFSSGASCQFSLTWNQITEYNSQFYFLKVTVKDVQGAEHQSDIYCIKTRTTNNPPVANIVSVSPIYLVPNDNLVTLKGGYYDAEGDPIVRCCWFIRPLVGDLTTGQKIYEGEYVENIQLIVNLQAGFYYIYFVVTDRTPIFSNWWKYAPNADWTELTVLSSAGPDAFSKIRLFPYDDSDDDHNSVGVCSAMSSSNSNTGEISAGFVTWAGGAEAWAQQEAIFTVSRTLHNVDITFEIAHVSGHYDFALAGEAQKLQLFVYKLEDGTWKAKSDIHWISCPSTEDILTTIIIDNFLKPFFFPRWSGKLIDAIAKCKEIDDAMQFATKLRGLTDTEYETVALHFTQLDPGTYRIIPYLAGAGLGLVAGSSSAYTYGQIQYIMIRESSNWKCQDWQGLIVNSSNFYDSQGPDFNLQGPADLIIIDPKGNIVTKTNSEIPYALYSEDHTPKGDIEDFISIPYGVNGTYKLYVIPDNNASVHDTFSLAVMSQNGNFTYLEKNETIENITSEPYEFNISCNNTPFIKIHTLRSYYKNDSVEIKWVAFDPEDLYNLPITIEYSKYGESNWSVIETNYPNTGVYIWDASMIDTGLYRLKLETNDSNGNVKSALGDYFIIENTSFHHLNIIPDKPAKPQGEMSGKIGKKYSYLTSTNDSDGDQVYYWFDWGDGTNSGWVGPFSSGVIANASHTWTTKNTYNISVKTKDIYGAESPWSDPLPITMPYSFNRPILQFLELLFQRFPNAFPLLRHLMGY